MSKKNVAIIFGGCSTEHEVSRESATAVIANLDKQKYNTILIGIAKDGKWLLYNGSSEKIANGSWEAESRRAGIDGAAYLFEEGRRGNIYAVFPVLHGLNGEDGTVQGMLELAGMPYVGPGVLGSAVGMDKVFSNIIFEHYGIPHCKYMCFTKADLESGRGADNLEKIKTEVGEKLGYPCFVKPVNAGSSVGITKVKDENELCKSINVALIYDRKVIIEEYVDGREIECAVLGNDNPVASVTGEVVPCNEFYDYDAKYKSGDESKIIIPANLPFNISEKIREYAIRAFKALDLSGMTRVDFFIRRADNEVLINEVNTIPGFTRISMYPKLWEATGLDYSCLLDRLIDLAVEKYKEKRTEKGHILRGGTIDA